MKNIIQIIRDFFISTKIGILLLFTSFCVLFTFIFYVLLNPIGFNIISVRIMFFIGEILSIIIAITDDSNWINPYKF